MEEKKKKKNIAGVLAAALMVLAGAAVGFLVGSGFMSPVSLEDVGFIEYAAGVVLALLLLAAALVLQLILHEGGHLIFGLLTGYGFSSFRLGSLMLLKTTEGFRFRRFSLAGTGGQCILTPPAENDGDFPVVLYNMGGVILNLLAFAVFLILYLRNRQQGYLSSFLLESWAIALFYALINGIPINTETVSNDGFNTLMLSKSKTSRKALWLMLTVNAKQTEGVRLKDMPETWFRLPEGSDLRNTLISSVAAFRENRLMDAGDFAAAETLIAELLSEKYRMIGLYRNLLLLDQVYIDILKNGKKADISILSDKGMKQFVRAMRKYPAVIRTMYAEACLINDSAEEMRRLEAYFEKCARAYPMPADIAMERDLMRICREKAEKGA